jgi:hypothetical protein
MLRAKRSERNQKEAPSDGGRGTLKEVASAARRDHQRFAWNLDGADLAEAFLAAAIGAVLAIRGYLAATGYPKLGGSSLHIAHVLWGGLLMVVALLMLLTLLGSRTRMAAAIVGGVGFGTFLDELGKFLTHDNNYFYRPAIALIYAIFVLTFFAVRALPRQRPWSDAERLAYAYAALGDLVIGQLSNQRRRRALSLLASLDGDPSGRSGSRGDDPAELEQLLALRSLLGRPYIPAAPHGRLASVVRAGNDLAHRLRRIVADVRFRRAVLALFFLLTGGVIVGIALNLAAVFTLRLTVTMLGSIVSLFAIGMLSLVGVAQLLRGARLPALTMFYRATQISIFFGQFFAFVAVQLLALPGLALNLAVLVALRVELAIEEEARRP